MESNNQKLRTTKAAKVRSPAAGRAIDRWALGWREGGGALPADDTRAYTC